MILCDIGNTSYHFLDKDDDYKKDVLSFKPSTLQDIIYYISVNHKVNALLKNLDNWIDLSTYIDKKDFYDTMGVDRIFASLAISNGVVVDAGSAITVDVVKDGNFKGGFIYPGKKAMQKTFKNISPALDYKFNYDLNLKSLPKKYNRCYKLWIFKNSLQ